MPCSQASSRTWRAAGRPTDTPIDPDGGPDGGPSDGAARGPIGTIVEEGGTLEAGARTAPGGGTSRLPCGTATCLIPAESCCLTDNADGTFTFGCVAGPSCPPAKPGETAPVALGCSSAANCTAGQVCCITQQNQNQGNDSSSDRGSSKCKSECTSQEGQLCDPAASSTGCPADKPCRSDKAEAWELPPSFGTCGAKGP